VLGKTFWLGAVTEISGAEKRGAETALHVLERKGFVRRERESSMEGDVEYTFLHVLVQEVAYAQLPRPARAEKHRAAAQWIESLGRPEDHAEMLAYHYGEALDLARAAGRSRRRR
jgi:predicted ATPase